MTSCILCGKETGSCLCENCRNEADLAQLCVDIATYRPGCGEHPLWDAVCQTLRTPYHFKNLVFALSDQLSVGRKSYVRVLGIAGNAANVPKDSRQWFYARYAEAKDTEALTALEKMRLNGLALGALYMDYRYDEAERVANTLYAAEYLPWQASFNLAKYYVVTRRYEQAVKAVTAFVKKDHENDLFALSQLEKLEKDISDAMKKAAAGKGEYLPNPKEGRDEVREKYLNFLASLGIQASLHSSNNRVPKPIPRDEYPEPSEIRDANFDTFVAFDLETTGLSPKIDSIIEIGAIKVVGGRIVESEQFIFQELAKPFDRKLSEEVQQLTGITPEDVKDARQMWEVFADFMAFAGNGVLVGFNCISFDGKFLQRAGRYSHIIMENKFFDVQRYAVQFMETLDLRDKKPSLESLADCLGVENPRAHRALPDAVTTAKIFLKLREMDSGPAEVGLGDLLSDLEEW